MTEPVIFTTPKKQDVLGGKGRTIMCHPGNISFRHIIQSNITAYLQAKKMENMMTVIINFCVIPYTIVPILIYHEDILVNDEADCYYCRVYIYIYIFIIVR